MPLSRQQVNRFEVDFFWPDLGLVVETDGLRYHHCDAAKRIPTLNTAEWAKDPMRRLGSRRSRNGLEKGATLVLAEDLAHGAADLADRGVGR